MLLSSLSACQNTPMSSYAQTDILGGNAGELVMAELRQELVCMEADHPLFRTHFPGLPRVPGSCIIQVFLDMLAEEAGENCQVEVQRFRFRHFLAPGTYVFELEPLQQGSFSARVRDGDLLACEGKLRCRSL